VTGPEEEIKAYFHVDGTERLGSSKENRKARVKRFHAKAGPPSTFTTQAAFHAWHFRLNNSLQKTILAVP
jgi:hypothetical protein